MSWETSCPSAIAQLDGAAAEDEEIDFEETEEFEGLDEEDDDEDDEDEDFEEYDVYEDEFEDDDERHPPRERDWR